MKNILISLILTLPFLSCETERLNENVNSLDNWKFYAEQSTDTIGISIPMNFMDVWYKNQLVEDLNFDDNAASIYIDFEKKWNLEKRIIVTKSQLEYKEALLELTHLDGFSSLYINDEKLAEQNNEAKIEWVDIKKYLVEGSNLIQLRFAPLFEEGKEVDPTSIPQYRNGNALSPNHRNAGLEGLSIHFNNNLSLGSYFVQAIDKVEQSTSFQLITDIRNEKYLGYEVQLVIPELAIDMTMEKEAIDSSGYVSFSFKVPSENLWNPIGLGKAHMVSATLKLSSEYGLVEELPIRLGFNVHQWQKVNQSYQYYINNQPYKVRAIELSPADIYQPRGTKAFWRKQLMDLTDIGVNCIKLNSDNFHAPESLLTLCDSMGILIWQDINFSRPAIGNSIPDGFNVGNQITKFVLQFRGHPSIMALGIGNIENNINSPLATFTKEEQGEILKKDIELFEYIAPKIVESGSGLRFFANSNTFWEMDEVIRPSSMTDYKYLELWLSDNEIFSHSKSWDCHNLSQQPLLNYYDSMLSNFASPIDLQALIYFSELDQDEKLRDYLKNRKTDKLVLLPLAYNEMWPSISPTVQSYFGTKKAVYYSLKKALQSYSFEVDQNGTTLSIGMNNNSGEVLHGVVEVELYNLLGVKIMADKFPLQLSNHNSGQVFFKDYEKELTDRIVKVKYLNGDSLCYSETFDFISYTKPNLPLPSPAYRVVQEKEESYLELFSESYMKMINLSANHLGYFKQNYFNLLPGDTLRIPFISEDTSYPLKVEEVSVYSYYHSYE